MFKKTFFLLMIFFYISQSKSQTVSLNNGYNNNLSKRNSILTTTPNDPRFQDQWGLTKIQAPNAWDITEGDPNMIIGILDSGIPLVNGSVTHEDFDPNRIILGVDYMGDANGLKDMYGHGTFMAGIIAAKTNNNLGIAGVNWNSKLYINQICDDAWGTPTDQRFSRGLRNAVLNNAKIINCSFGFIYDQYGDSAYAAVQFARDHNCLIVASGGNEGESGNEVRYPAKYSLDFDNVIAVSATDINDNVRSKSTYGNHICLAAPGSNIVSTFPNYSISSNLEPNIPLNYGTLDGSSMAAAYTTGVASLLWGRESSLTPSQVRTILEQSSDDIVSTGWDNRSGWGRLNAYNALRITTAGTLPGNEVWRGTVNVTSDLTIPPGKRLTILSGTTVNISAGVNFTVNGLLNLESGFNLNFNNSNCTFTINGTLSAFKGNNSYVTCSANTSVILSGSVNNITFQGNGTKGSWFGIKLNSGSNISMSDCIIKDASYGVYVYNTTPTLSGLTIQNCTRGAFFYSSGVNILRYGRITGNTTGMVCDGYSNTLSYDNKITDNDTNISIFPYSAPDFGRYSDQGHNSIFSSITWDIYSRYSGSIYAEYNWWGGAGDPFVVGNIDYTNPLNYDPNPLMNNDNRNKEVSQNILKKTSRLSNPLTTEIPGIKEVDEARGLFILGKYSEALNIFELTLNNYSDNLSGEISLFFIDECLSRLNRETDRNQMLDDIVKNKNKTVISAVAQLLKRKHLAMAGKYNEAVNNALNLKNDFPNSRFEKYSLYDIGNLYWYNMEDKQNSEKYFRDLIKLYPNDPLTESALAVLGEWKPKSKEINKPTVLSKSGSSDVLEQNYPNPYNPSTNISFTVPKDGNVKLVVYDMLGREINKLVNETMSSGKYSVKFDGSNISSGIYSNRILITPSDGSERIMHQRSMQIIK